MLQDFSNGERTFDLHKVYLCTFDPKIQNILRFSTPKVDVYIRSLKSGVFSLSQCFKPFSL